MQRFWRRAEFVMFLENKKNIWLRHKVQQGEQWEVTLEKQAWSGACRTLYTLIKSLYFILNNTGATGGFYIGQWCDQTHVLQRLLRMLCREVDGERQEERRGEQLRCYCNCPGIEQWWLGQGQWQWQSRTVNRDVIYSDSRTDRTCWGTGYG